MFGYPERVLKESKWTGRYECAHFPMDLPDAVEAIKFGWSNLVWPSKISKPVIGRKNRVYEV